MLFRNKGIKTDKFYLPPFDLDKGELLIVYLPNNHESFDIEMYLKDLFTQKIKDKNLIVTSPLKLVEHFKESLFRRYFYPTTVGEYLKKMQI